MVAIIRQNYTLIHGNNRDHYDRLVPVQCVLTDPPYGDEVHLKDKLGRKPDGEVDAMPVPFDQLDAEDVARLAVFLREHCRGWALVFSQTEQINFWREQMEGLSLDASGEKLVRYNRPMVWIKPDAKPNFRGHGPGTGFETIQAYWCGGGPQSWNGGGQVGVFYHPRGRRVEGELKHPTAKPVSLMKELVRLFTNPGDIIFDPFMGCGSTGIAAIELGRRFIGIEKDETYFNEAARRMEESASAEVLVTEDAKMPTLFGNSAYGSTNTKKRLRREAKEKEDANP